MQTTILKRAKPFAPLHSAALGGLPGGDTPGEPRRRRRVQLFTQSFNTSPQDTWSPYVCFSYFSSFSFSLALVALGLPIYCTSQFTAPPVYYTLLYPSIYYTPKFTTPIYFPDNHLCCFCFLLFTVSLDNQWTFAKPIILMIILLYYEMANLFTNTKHLGMGMVLDALSIDTQTSHSAACRSGALLFAFGSTCPTWSWSFASSHFRAKPTQRGRIVLQSFTKRCSHHRCLCSATFRVVGTGGLEIGGVGYL